MTKTYSKTLVPLLLSIIMVVSACTVLATTTTADAATPKPYTGPFVGSKNSNVYHYPWCVAAKNIKPQNKVSFANAKAALAHGYRPCQVCKPVTATPQSTPSSAIGPFVGSKNSNVYHYPKCPDALKIKPGNLVTFSTLAKAKAAGYRPCLKCHPPS